MNPAPRRPPARPRPAAEAAADSVPTAYLRPADVDRVLAGHPWVYEGAVDRVTREPRDGDVVQVKDLRRRFLGVGFYNSRSKIRVRVLAQERVELDDAFFKRRLEAALGHRRRFLPEATSCRLVNAEGDRLSGLIVDRYEDVLVLQTSSVGMEQRKPMLVRLLQELVRPRAIVERNDMAARRFEGLPPAEGLLAGSLGDDELKALPVRLNGLQFRADLSAGHKTGLYLDQQENHALVARLAAGGRVLDCFSFMGGFGLAAARAGAAEVTLVDQSADAVARAERAAAEHGLSDRCRFATANVFDWLREQTAAPPHEQVVPRYDLAILDPPSFTRTRSAVPDALRGYKEIHLRALRLVRPGGLIATFCCSHHVPAPLFESAIVAAAHDARRQLRRVAVYAQAADHPVLPAVPETEYLKGFAYEVLPA
ncbi:MAG: class I SAM-dependent rRNA methyltransferase [Limisphaerales bacterium]